MMYRTALCYLLVGVTLSRISSIHQRRRLGSPSSIESIPKTQAIFREEEPDIDESVRGCTVEKKVPYGNGVAMLRRLDEKKIEFRKHEIDTEANGAREVFAIDVDGDGDIDVLSTSSWDQTIAWYENDGNQVFTKHEIETSTCNSLVYAVDMDGDGDIDVLTCVRLGDDAGLAWYENEGNQIFTRHEIIGIRIPFSVSAIDVDGDGDIDILSATTRLNDDVVTWYENDGTQVFTKHGISMDAGIAGILAVSVSGLDVDGDGDIDVLATILGKDTIAWYENDGDQVFTKHEIDTDAKGVRLALAIDVDGDGDIDVLSASEWDDTIAWYENDGNQGFTKHEITKLADGAFSVFGIDVDGDSDIDVLSASIHDDTVAWYENDGNQIFTKHNISTDAHEASSVFAIDMDGDNDIDVLSASFADDTVAWYENLLRESTASPSYSQLPTPNPTYTPTPSPTLTRKPIFEPASRPTQNPDPSTNEVPISTEESEVPAWQYQLFLALLIIFSTCSIWFCIVCCPEQSGGKPDRQEDPQDHENDQNE